MNVSISYYTAIGRRKTNEDALSAAESKRGLLAVVADGLGGHQNGEFASREAVNTMNRLLVEEEIDEDGLEDAVLASDEAVRRLHESRAPGALTTIAALWLDERHAAAAHVGDTRIYQFRGGRVLYQSVDHSAAQLAVMAGEISLEEIRGHRDRNKLIRVLGGESAPRVAQRLLDVRANDAFLLCSDGFWEQIREEEMLAALEGKNDAGAWLDEMRKRVEPAARDNNTAICIIIR